MQIRPEKGRNCRVQMSHKPIDGIRERSSRSDGAAKVLVRL